MPSAFPTGVAITNKLKTIFENRFINSSQHGALSNFVCEFVEDEHGVCYFLKVAELELGPF
jgi:hypothetical protein